MNIYHIGWVQDDQFGLSSVVIAPTADDALRELDLDDEYESDVRVSLLGACTDDLPEAARTVCREWL